MCHGHGTGIRTTGPVPILRCRYISIGVRHGHGTGLGNTGTVLETQNQTWNAPEQTRIRHCNRNMQSALGMITESVTITGPDWDRSRKNGTGSGNTEPDMECSRTYQNQTGTCNQPHDFLGVRHGHNLWDQHRNMELVRDIWNTEPDMDTGRYVFFSCLFLLLLTVN